MKIDGVFKQQMTSWSQLLTASVEFINPTIPDLQILPRQHARKKGRKVIPWTGQPESK